MVQRVALQREFTREMQVKYLESFLTSEAVATRQDPLQRAFDRLVQHAYEQGEIELAMGLWALMGCRSANIHGEAAGDLLSRLYQLHAQGKIRQILEEDGMARSFTEESSDGSTT